MGDESTAGHYIAVVRKSPGWLVCDDAKLRAVASRPVDSRRATTVMCLYQKYGSNIVVGESLYIS